MDELIDMMELRIGRGEHADDVADLDLEQLRAAFNNLRRFVPASLVDLIVRGSTDALYVHRRAITVAFFDLRGFASFAESAEPEEVISVLRDYHQVLGQLVAEHGGTLQRFSGDGIMVFFNDPVPVPDPQARAVAVALAAHERMGALVRRWQAREVELGLGVGISHGFATVGVIGTDQRFDYAAIGTVTNVATRLCARAQSGEILVCTRVLHAVEDHVAFKPLGRLQLDGFRRAVDVFQILAAKSADA
jgi:adenylate cyclase